MCNMHSEQWTDGVTDCCLTMNTKSMFNKPIQMNCKFYLNLAFEQSFKINSKYWKKNCFTWGNKSMQCIDENK